MGVGVVLYLLLVVGLVVGALVWFYCKYCKVSDALARKIEIIGYVLLFILVVWEFIVKDIMFESFYNADFLYINQKLHYIYSAITSLITGQTYDTVNGWNGFYANESSKYVQNQLLTVNVIEAVLQLTSVVCIAVGRFQELRTKKTNNAGNNKAA